MRVIRGIISFMRLLLPIAVLLLMASSLHAQRDRDTYTNSSATFEVSGEVRFADAAVPPNVQVRLERFSGGLIDQIVLDSRGRFRFPNLPRGYYKVIINAPGYRPAQQDADLQVVFRTYLVFELISDSSSKPTSGLPLLTDVVDARVPSAAREDFNNGRAALSKKNYKDGIAYLEKATLGYSKFFEAYLLLGIAHMDLKEWDKAEQCFQRAIEIKPQDASATIYLGEVYWREKRYPDAEQTLREGLKLDEKSWHGQFTLGRLYWDMGEVAKAAAPIGMTLQLKPDLAEAHLLGGNILLRFNQRERALVEYREYLRLAPKGEFVTQVEELIHKVEKSLQ